MNRAKNHLQIRKKNLKLRDPKMDYNPILFPLPKYQQFNYAYTLITPAAELLVSLAEIKEHLRLDPDDTSQDTYLTHLITAATEFGEKSTWRDFLNKTWRTYRNNFYHANANGIYIQRSRLQSVEFIKYYKDNILTTVDSSIYYFIESQDFSTIYIKIGNQFPMDVDTRMQAVQIQFVSGYGADAADVPSALRQAVMMHVTALYENRGDCGSDCGSSAPSASMAIYNNYRIRSM